MGGRDPITGRRQTDALHQGYVRGAVGADIAEIFAAQREKAAVSVEGEFGRHRKVAAHVVAGKGLVAFAGPLHRSANLARTPGDERELGEKAVSRTKIAADFVGEDADRFKWHAEDRGQLLFLTHDAA